MTVYELLQKLERINEEKEAVEKQLTQTRELFRTSEDDRMSTASQLTLLNGRHEKLQAEVDRVTRKAQAAHEKIRDHYDDKLGNLNGQLAGTNDELEQSRLSCDDMSKALDDMRTASDKALKTSA